MPKKTTSKSKKPSRKRKQGPQKKKAQKPARAGGQKTKNPVRIMDTTLRDGHQSILATRLRIEDMIPILDRMNRAGFAAMEVWGGATFDATTRFLNEDPWERLATIKKRLPDTPVQMLLRGQNLVGYRHYPDDVVEAFVDKAAETGIDVFRVFDALNDERNMISSFQALKRCKKHIQGTICYSLTERRLGGPIYNLKYYADKARTLEEMGADSLCIKDMAGIMAPYDAFELVSMLKSTVGIPIQLHTHYTSGMGSMTYLKAVEAGVDIIDCALAPLALRTSQPAIEPILVALEGSDRDPGIELELLTECGEHLDRITPKYCELLDTTCLSVIDSGVLVHQIPGGMRSNLTSQLREADALDRIHEVFEELPRTRKDLGFPPLVTPSSQIVGTQAVMNVLFGRYKQVSQPTKDYVAGLYGRPPAKIDPEVQKTCLQGHKYKKPITKRPGDVLEPELEKAREAVKDVTADSGDVLIYALYPTTGMQFLKWKHGLEEPPQKVRPKTMEQAGREQELMEKARRGELVEPPDKQAPEKSGACRCFNVFVDGEYFQVEVDPVQGMSVTSGKAGPSATSSAGPKQEQQAAGAGRPPPPAGPDTRVSSARQAPGAAGKAGAVTAPMPGIIIEYRVKDGDKVAPGDVLLVLEAMKMQNEIKAEKAGTVSSVGFNQGDSVHKGDLLLVIED